MSTHRDDPYKPSEKTQAAVLRAARVLAGLKQTEAAEIYGVSRRTLISAESGRNTQTIAQNALPALDKLGVKTEFREDQSSIWRQTSNDDLELARNFLVPAARHAAGLTQDELAAASGVSRRSIISFEQTGLASDLIRSAIFNTLYRRRIKTFVNKDESGVGIIADHIPLRPFAGNSSPIEDSVTRINRSLDVMTDVDHPAFTHYRVEIIGSQPQIWREILIPENATFEDLHVAIQAAFNWRTEHLHEFSTGLRIGPEELNHEGFVCEGKVIDERLVWLYDLTATTDFEYLYDYGNRWRHLIIRGDNEIANNRPCRPTILDGAGAGPIENAGGIDAFNQKANDIRKNRCSSELRTWLKRCGYDGYNPDTFNLAQANKRLADHDFEIPTSWLTQHELRSSIIVTAPHLEARAERQRKKETTVLAVDVVRLLEIKKLGAENFFDSGEGVKTGSTHSRDRRRDRPIVTTCNAGYALINAVVYASDVDDYEILPLNISYEVDGSPKIFAPDLLVKFKNGEQALIHVLDERDIPLLREYELLSIELQKAGHDIIFIGVGAADDPLNRNGSILSHNAPTQILRAQPQEITNFLKNLALEKKRLPFSSVVNALISSGHANKHQNHEGAQPKDIASRQILEAVQQGHISMDMSLPTENTVIAAAGYFDDHAPFRDFLVRNIAVTPPRRRARRKKKI